MYCDIEERPVTAPARSLLAEERPVAIAHQDDVLTGSFSAPSSPRAALLIANDRGCARHTPALLALARELRAAGFATLMVDLLTAAEQTTEDTAARLRTEPVLLAERLDSARSWLLHSKLAGLPVVLFGMGESAAAALLSAAARPANVAAVIACGPKPDAAGIALEMVSAPTLLIAHAGPFGEVGSHVRALGRMRCERDLVVLHQLDDPIKRSLDIARAAVAFLAFIRRFARQAA